MGSFGNFAFSFETTIYPKKIILVQAEKGNHPIDSNWSNLGADGVTAHVVSGANHMDMLQEPSAASWAKWLNMHLHEAQAKNKGFAKME